MNDESTATVQKNADAATVRRAELAAQRVGEIVEAEHRKLNLPIIEYRDGKIVEVSPFTDRVFVSYTRESEQHIERVRSLVQKLKAAGIDVIFDEDQPAGGPNVGWPVWSANAAELTPHILVVFTAVYEKCWRGQQVPGTRDGATHEAMSLANRVYLGGASTDFLRPVVFDEKDSEHIPFRLRGITRFHGERDVSQILSWLRALPVNVAPVSAETLAASAPKPKTFMVGQPVTGHYFVGREKENRAFMRMLERRESYNLLGDSCIGKSSLLLKWQNMARLQQHECHIVNFQSIKPSVHEFIRVATGSALRLPDSIGIEDAANALEEWASRYDVPPVIMVDESEEMVRGLAYRFFERLRGMAATKVQFVFVSRRELHDVFKAEGRTSPFMNLLLTQRLGLLSPAAADELANRAGEYAGILKSWAGKHPYHLQCFGRFLEDVGDDYTISDALSDYQDTAMQRFSELRSRLSKEEMNCLRNAHAGMCVKHDELHRRGLLDEGRPFGEILTKWIKERGNE